MTSNSSLNVINIPLDTLCFLNGYFNLIFIQKKHNKHLILSIMDIGYTFLLMCLRFELKNINFIQDSFFYNQIITTHLSCYFKQNNILIHTFLKENLLYSLSYVYQSFSWLEREISELDHLYVVGLRDSRRLLTNYLFSSDIEVYNTSSYNCIIQNL